MRFGMMATGGVGGYFGGMIARAGGDVRFIARGEHLEAIRTKGLRVDCAEPKPFTVEGVFATDDPAEAGPCDVIFYAVKTTANDAGIAAIEPMMGENTIIIDLQNGVDNEEQLAAAYGEMHVMGGTAYILTSVEGPGVIKQIGGPRRIVVGELGGGPSERGAEILAELKGMEINAEYTDDIQAELWTKFLFICAVNGMTALTRSPIGEIMAWEGTRAMMRGIMREVYETGRARGVSIPDGTDERLYAFLDEQNPASKGSMCHDIEAGRRLEIETLNGTASRLGKEAGVDTPLNDYIYRTLKLADMQAAGEIGLKE
jgi:2-dehydropantoate 2-reductase